MIDFNDDGDTSVATRPTNPDQRREEIRAALLDRLESVLVTLFPAGKVRDKGEQIETIDLRGQTDLADYMVVASGTSTRHVGAMAEKIQERLKTLGYGDVRAEGLGDCNWVVVDAVDVVVHIFRPEVREYYNIEKMWRSGPADEVKIH